MKKVSLFDWFIFILLTLVWGSSFILMKKGLEAFSSSQVAGLRIFLAGIVLAPFAWAKRKEIKREQIRPIIIMGLCGSAIPAFLFTAAETQISSSLTGILNSLTPIFVLLLGILFYRANYKPLNVLGIFIGFTGTAMLMLFENHFHAESTNAWYALLVVLATLLYGLSNQVIIAYLKNSNPIAYTSVAFIFISPFAGAYLLTTNIFTVLKSNPLALSSLGYTCILSVVGTCLALIMYNYLVQKTGALFASSLTFLMPIVAVGWGLLAGEHIGVEHLLAMLVILTGVYLVKK